MDLQLEDSTIDRTNFWNEKEPHVDVNFSKLPKTHTSRANILSFLHFFQRNKKQKNVVVDCNLNKKIYCINE